MNIGLICKSLLIVAAMTVSGFVFAHSGATGVVKQRMDMMGEIGDSMKIIGTMIKTGDFNPSAAQDAANAISSHATSIKELFPTDSLDKPSEALPQIWTDWDEFIAIGEQMGVEAEKLAKMAGGSSSVDEIKDQFRRLGQSCRSCHEKFRVKQ